MCNTHQLNQRLPHHVCYLAMEPSHSYPPTRLYNSGLSLSTWVRWVDKILDFESCKKGRLGPYTY